MSDNHEVYVDARAAWRAQGMEEVLWPEQRICDAHHHLWGHDGDRYFAAEFAADLGDGHQVMQTVYVECGSAYRDSGPLELAPLGETEFVLGQEAKLAALRGRPTITGIIGFADLTRGHAAADVLAAHIDAGGGRFKGVRHAVAWDASPDIVNHQRNPPPALLRDPRFAAGVSVLGEMGLTYDVWLYHRQLPEIIDLARAVPGTTIIVDHLGAPLGLGPYAGKREEVWRYCRAQLTEFAKLPNARIKLGGIGMTILGNGWHRQPAPPSSLDIGAQWGDQIRWCIDTFGPQRALFESNFPPDRRSCSYRTLWNAYKRIAEPYSAAERDWLFHDTAVAVYGL